MPLVIDTYNVLYTTGVLPPDLAGIDIEALLALIAGSRYRSQRITLVCDGTGKGRKRIKLAKTITLRFSGPHRKADDLIVELLDKSTARKRITVVTSDRAVAKAAKARQCATLTSQLFLEHLSNDAQSQFGTQSAKEARSHKPLDDKAVQKWIDEFKLDESELTKPTTTSTGISPAPGHNPKDLPKKKKTKPKRASDKSKNLDDAHGLPSKVIEEAEDMLNDEDDR